MGRHPDPVRAGARLRWAAAVAAYVGYAVVVLRPIWSARAEPRFDGLDFNYPSFAYAADALRHGRLPLWDPFTNCGQPFIADPALLWYQPGAVLAMFARSSPFDGYMLFWAAIWLWAGLGAFVLAAVLRTSPVGCLVAAIAFSMSGFFVGHGQQVPYLVTAAWLPWGLALAHLAVERERWVLALAAGAALGLSARGGYGGLVVFEVLAVALWLALAFLWPGAGPAVERGVPRARRIRWVAVTLGASVVVLVLIWSPALWAFLVEAAGFTDRRQPLPPELVLRGNPFPLQAALTLLYPELTVLHAPFFPTDLSMIDAYVGALALPFAAVWVAAERRRAVWLVAFAACWFLTSLGEAGGIRVLLHYAVPPTRFMRHNGMLRVLFLLPLAVAAGAGVSRAVGSARASAFARNAALALLGVVALTLPGVAATFGWTRSLAYPAVLAAAAVVLLAIPARWRVHALVGPALAALFAADLAWHVDANAVASWHAPPNPIPRQVEARPKAPDPLVPRLTDPRFLATRLNLVERRPVVTGFVSLSSAAFTRLTEGRFLEVLARDRYWLSPSARPAPPQADGVAALAAVGADQPVPVFVAPPEAPIDAAPVVPGTFGSVDVVAYAPERVALEVVAPGPGDAVLASTERTAPSWRATVDGAPREVAVVNYFFRGVRVPPGTHRVEFRYDPRPFVSLLALSSAVLATIVALVVAAFGRAGWRALAVTGAELRALVSRRRTP